MDALADLHVHTTASDGLMTPAAAVQSAHEVGLVAIAITDHDTVDGIDEALAAGRELEIEVVPGVEISALGENEIEIHILGYFIDHHDPELIGKLQILANARWERGRRMVEQLNDVGIRIRFDRVEEIAGGGAIGRPHVARAICEAGIASSMDSAFGKYLIKGCPGYVPRYKVTPSEAVRMIITAGGVACCAHVAKLKRDELVVQLIREGLKAVEVYHPDHGSAASRFYKRFALAQGLIATGGSDAHGYPGGAYGPVGCVTVSADVVDELRQAARQRSGT